MHAAHLRSALSAFVEISSIGKFRLSSKSIRRVKDSKGLRESKGSTVGRRSVFLTRPYDANTVEQSRCAYPQVRQAPATESSANNKVA
jgi:hypothetical protein